MGGFSIGYGIGIGPTAKRFSPLAISGLQLWLDATTGLYDATSGGNSVTTDGSSIARWEDQSGNGYHVTQGTEVNKPILKTAIKNSKNVVRFDGSNDGLFSENIAENNLSKMTAFVVAYVAGYGVGSFGRYFERGVGARQWLVDGSPTANSNRLVVATSVTHRTASNSIITGNWYLSSAKWDGGGNMATNILQRINKADSTANSTGAGTIQSVANTTYQIGNRTALDRTFNGDIAELIIYNTELTIEQLNNVENYLASKWAVS